MTIGWDLGSGDDVAVTHVRRGCMLLCEVPPDLGQVTEMYERGGKVICETTGGFHFIVPHVPVQNRSD